MGSTNPVVAENKNRGSYRGVDTAITVGNRWHHRTAALLEMHESVVKPSGRVEYNIPLRTNETQTHTTHPVLCKYSGSAGPRSNP